MGHEKYIYSESPSKAELYIRPNRPKDCRLGVITYVCTRNNFSSYTKNIFRTYAKNKFYDNSLILL